MTTNSTAEYRTIGVSGANYQKLFGDIKNTLESYKIGDPILANKIIESVYDQLVYEEVEPFLDMDGVQVPTTSFELRKEQRQLAIEDLKYSMEHYAKLEKDKTKPVAYRKQMAIKVVTLTYMYEALTEHSIEKCKEVLGRSAGSIDVFAATHCILQFDGKEHGLPEGSKIAATFYDGISGDAELLLLLNMCEDDESRRDIIKNHIELTGVVYVEQGANPAWALLTEETPYMHLILSQQMA